MGIIFSITTLKEANLDFRATEVNLYEKDEALWNSTYRDQLRNINISLIFDKEMHLENLKEIGELQNQIKSSNQTGKEALNKQLQKLEDAQDLLMMPLKVREDGRGNKSEAHLLNKYDARGNLPEYKPYSLVTYGYQPLSNW